MNTLNNSKKEYQFDGDPAKCLAEIISHEQILKLAMERIRHCEDPELTYHLLNEVRAWMRVALPSYILETHKQSSTKNDE